ncbi:hypothetical protein HCU40_07540 [Pseudanabaena biceps]|nr:hypothetical protein [Pseudanabaena biceps]
MSTEEATIARLQNRIDDLELHLHLALQVLNAIYLDNEDSSSEVRYLGQTVDVEASAKVSLPPFLGSRTWKHHANYEKGRIGSAKKCDLLLPNVS